MTRGELGNRRNLVRLTPSVMPTLSTPTRTTPNDAGPDDAGPNNADAERCSLVSSYLNTMLSIALSCGLLLGLAGCSVFDDSHSQPPARGYGQESYGQGEPTPTVVAPQRLEDTWGPGEFAALLTGTVSSKDRNFFFNLPLLAWYVREQERNGMGLLGGLLAYDMIHVEHAAGQPVARKLTSFGLLGIAGRTRKEPLLAGGDYHESHWLFPFYRYHNVNGERMVYPLMIFPWALARDDRAPAASHPRPWQPGSTPRSRKLDPDPIDISQRREPRTLSLPAPPVQERARNITLQTPSRPAPPPLAQLSPVAARGDQMPAPKSVAAPDSRSSRTSIQARGGSQSAGYSEGRRAAKTAKAAAPREQTKQQYYRVEKGDTLYSIARRFYGSGKKWRKILDANRSVLSAERVKIGQKLLIPRG